MEENEIRTDLWNTMDTSQLVQQRELILTKLSLLASTTQTQTILNIYSAMQMALNDITDLLDRKISESNSKVGFN